MGKGRVREFGTDVYTWLHLNGYQRGPAIWHRETHSVSRGWLDGREVSGRMNTCPFLVNLKLWLTGYTPRGMEWGGRREEGSGWGTHGYLWRIHFDIWQN